ncbi:hypothetical protein ACFO25_02365 [Paenactinomyces guangxiensis]|uniref:Uncharacterized protein n=1 Tax=Paenactinomyces guangxiensis TaxID=1490290 RepID=A0A7W2AA35_9BACL|nr:hypothetical protein [Paenactinomyces guangxiensis]MBA4496370.1 hypothetical protein [Paenactinomyces guangxiensis]MBH8593517.1 hypothetical protein [Paenactinomyces guangxiensis]
MEKIGLFSCWIFVLLGVGLGLKLASLNQPILMIMVPFIFFILAATLCIMGQGIGSVIVWISVLGILGSIINILSSILVYGLTEGLDIFDHKEYWWASLIPSNKLVGFLANTIGFMSFITIFLLLPFRSKRNLKFLGTWFLLLALVCCVTSPLFYLFSILLFIITGILCIRKPRSL